MPDLSTIIIDDEPDAGKLLQNLLKNYPAINVKHLLTDSEQALNTVVTEQPAVVFADIEMPKMTGLVFLQQVNLYSPLTKVVFVTAYKDHALEALQNDAFDFICKPIDKNDLQRVVYKLITSSGWNEKQSGNKKQILLKTAEGYHYIYPENILFLEADANYTKLWLTDGKKLLSSMNLGRIQNELLPEQFVRISRKHVINKNYLSFINFNKRYCIVSTNEVDHKLEISSKMKDLKQELS